MPFFAHENKSPIRKKQKSILKKLSFSRAKNGIDLRMDKLNK
jgi:hypothetical protein